MIDGLGRVATNQILALTGAEALPLIRAGNARPDHELDELKERARKLGKMWMGQGTGTPAPASRSGNCGNKFRSRGKFCNKACQSYSGSPT